MHYIGIDIGGTNTKAGLVDETGRVLESRRVLTNADDIHAFLLTLSKLVREFQKSVPVEAIGIGVPGLHSSRTHIVETSPNIPSIQKLNLEAALADQVHIRTTSENDANAAAYAEFVCGRATGLQHMVHLTLGTGLGSGFILNGKLFTGASGYGGELGHTILDIGTDGHQGRLCACGHRGCTEMYVSAAGIVATAREMMQDARESLLHETRPPLTSKKIYEAAAQGDVTAQRVFQKTGWYLGIACANLINLLNLEMIVLGGGVMAAADLLLNSILDSAQSHAFASTYADCRIVQSQLWPDAGIIGAAMLARDR